MKTLSIKTIVAVAILFVSVGAVLMPTSAHASRNYIDYSNTSTVRVIYIPVEKYPKTYSDWPLRTEGCIASAIKPVGSPSTVYKSVPWMPQVYPGSGASYDGNTFDISGDCANRYVDAGPGSWIFTTAYSGWTKIGTNTTSAPWKQALEKDTAGSIHMSPGQIPANSQAIWGAAVNDNQPKDTMLFQQNGFTSYSAGEYELYGNGSTLFRQEFELTQAEVNQLNQPNSSAKLDIIADDWYIAYVNGVKQIESKTTSVRGFVEMDTAKKAAFVVGTNVLAIQVVDKMAWLNDVRSFNRESGLAYAFFIETDDITYNLQPTITGDLPVSEGSGTVGLTPIVENIEAIKSPNNTEWRVTTFVLQPSTAKPTGGPSAADPVAYFRSKGAISSSVKLADGAAAGQQGFSNGKTDLTVSDQEFGEYAVGTKICYALSVKPYINVDVTQWKHSDPYCVTIGITPKVQVLGNDLMTGRNFAGVSTPAPTSNVQSSVTVKKEPVYIPPFSSSMVTGLWQTGVNNSGVRLSPGKSDPHWQLARVYPGNANGTTLKPAAGDGHWTSSNGAATCQPGPYPRAATVVNTAGVDVGVNNAWKASLSNSGWIGAYSDAYTMGKSGSCTYPAYSDAIDQATFERGPIWVFRLTNGFNIDECVNPGTIRLNFNLSADDEAQVLVNGVTVAQPGNFAHYGQWPTYPVSYTTGTSSAFRTGNNTLEIRVKSAYQYTGLLVNSVTVAAGQCKPVQPQKTYGSWVEYAILSTGIVKDTSSASASAGGVATITHCETAMLTLPHTSTTGACADGSVFGSYRTGKTIPDIASYFPTSVSTPTLPASTSLTNVASGTYKAPDNLEITASSIPEGKSIVINAPNSTVTIVGNIDYTTAAMTASERVPQVVIIAKDIKISNSATKVDSWLVTRGTLNTCSNATAMAELRVGVCDARLTVNGPVQAGKLELWRTAGSGTDTPAEIFNLRPDAYLWGLAQAAKSGRLETVYEQELPPRF